MLEEVQAEAEAAKLFMDVSVDVLVVDIGGVEQSLRRRLRRRWWRYGCW